MNVKEFINLIWAGSTWVLRLFLLTEIIYQTFAKPNEVKF